LICEVLGNGPSLSDSLTTFNFSERNSSLLVVNNFAVDKIFLKFKPDYYVLLDPSYKNDSKRSDIEQTWDAISRVDWGMTLFVPNSFGISFVSNKLMNNKKIKIIFYNYVIFQGYKGISYFLYKKGLASPQFYNVLGASIFIALLIGYKKIYVFGADHSWFKDLVVNENNEVCRKDIHFYDKNKQLELTKVVNNIDKKSIKLSSFFMTMSIVFRSYEILNEFSLYLNSVIVNKSSESFIDAFSRSKQK
jgi:hypothetical protein